MAGRTFAYLRVSKVEQDLEKNKLVHWGRKRSVIDRVSRHGLLLRI